MTLLEANALAVLRSSPDRYRYIGLEMKKLLELRKELIEAAANSGLNKHLAEHLEAIRISSPEAMRTL